MQGVITPIFLILAAVIGLLVGLLVSNLFSSKETKKRDGDSVPVDLAKDGFGEEARLWYSPSGKRIITQLDGDFYRDYLTLSPEQKSRVNKLMTLWADWAGKSLEIKIEKSAHLMVDPNSGESLGAPKDSIALDWSVNEAIKHVDEPQPEADQPKTIADQINLVIDKLIEGTSFKERGIRLMENSQQGVDVWIGLEKFDGIDAIPYPEVQEVIRKAVVLWEKQNENANP